MSMLSAIKTYLAAYAGLEAGAPLWVDFLGATPIEYAIVPQPGAKVVESNIDGSSTREFPFAFQSTVSTADDANRLETNEFYETFSDWLEAQTEAGALPTLGTKKTATAIEALSWAFLMQQGESETAIYQILCKLTYDQAP